MKIILIMILGLVSISSFAKTNSDFKKAFVKAIEKGRNIHTAYGMIIKSTSSSEVSNASAWWSKNRGTVHEGDLSAQEVMDVARIIQSTEKKEIQKALLLSLKNEIHVCYRLRSYVFMNLDILNQVILDEILSNENFCLRLPSRYW